MLELIRCKNLLNEFKCHPETEPFHEPVDWKGLNLPDYPLIITKPIDFGTISNRLDTNKYPSAQEFAYDMRLVFKNAKQYNTPGSNLWNVATEYLTKFEQRLAEITRNSSKRKRKRPINRINRMRRMRSGNIISRPKRGATSSFSKKTSAIGTNTYNKREIDKTLPSRWNIVKHKKNIKRDTDPMSYNLFGTMRGGASSRSNTKINQQHNVLTKSMRNPTKRQQKMISARNKHYIDNYNFTNFIVKDGHPIRCGKLLQYQSKESYKVDQGNFNIAKIRFNDDGTMESDYSDSNDGDNMDIDGDKEIDSDDGDEMAAEDVDMEEEVDVDFFYADINSNDESYDEEAEKEDEEYENSGWLTQEEKQEKFRGIMHLRMIRKWQKNAKLLISKEEFESFVGNVICNDNTYSNDVKFQQSAMLALQEGTESFLVDLFEMTNLMAINSERTMINDDDIIDVLKIWKKNQNEWIR